MQIPPSPGVRNLHYQNLCQKKIALWESYKISKFGLFFDILFYLIFFGVIIGVLSFIFNIGYARTWPIIIIFGVGLVITILSFFKNIYNNLNCVVIKITLDNVEIYDKTGENIQKVFDITNIDKIESIIDIGGEGIFFNNFKLYTKEKIFNYIINYPGAINTTSQLVNALNNIGFYIFWDENSSVYRRRISDDKKIPLTLSNAINILQKVRPRNNIEKFIFSIITKIFKN